MRSLLVFITLGLTAPALAQNPAPVPQISVVGTAMRDVEPDRATIAVGVTTERTNAVDVANENAKAARAIVDAIAVAGIERRDIRTSAITLAPIYTQGSPTVPPIIRAYRASNQVSVVVRKIDVVGALVGKLTEKGVTNISGPTFDVSNATAIVDDLRADAAKDARRKAEMSCSSTGHQTRPRA